MSTHAHGQHIFLDYNGFFPAEHQDGNWVLKILQEVVARSTATEVHAHVELFMASPHHLVLQLSFSWMKVTLLLIVTVNLVGLLSMRLHAEELIQVVWLQI